MSTGRRYAGKRLLLTLAFGALVAAAIGAGCNGFFVNPTLTAIGISPGNQTIPLTPPGNTQQFSAIGTFNDGTSGSTSVTWSSNSPTTVASIGTNSGLATAVGVGTATITATSTILPTITGTTQLTVVPGNVTSITVTPSSQSVANGGTFELLAKDQGGNNISGSVTWTFTLNGTVETGMILGTPGSSGQSFTVGTLSPALTTFPANLNAVATLTVSGTTVTSNTVVVTVTSS